MHHVPYIGPFCGKDIFEFTQNFLMELIKCRKLCIPFWRSLRKGAEVLGKLLYPSENVIISFTVRWILVSTFGGKILFSISSWMGNRIPSGRFLPWPAEICVPDPSGFSRAISVAMSTSRSLVRMSPHVKIPLILLQG